MQSRPPYVHKNWYDPEFTEIVQKRRRPSKTQMFHDRVQSIMTARRLTYVDVADLSGLTRTRAKAIIENRIKLTAWEVDQFAFALDGRE